MSDAKAIGVLLVEDNAQDAELALRALRQANLTNHIRVAHGGAEATEILFGDECEGFSEVVRKAGMYWLLVNQPAPADKP
jgi:hypothetical protein